MMSAIVTIINSSIIINDGHRPVQRECHPQGPKLTSYTASASTTGRRAHGPDPTPRGNIDMHGRGRRNFPRRGGCLHATGNRQP